MKILRRLTRIVLSIWIGIGIFIAVVYFIAIVIDFIYAYPEIKDGEVWVSDDPKMYIARVENGEPSGQLEIDGEFVEVIWGQKSKGLQLSVIFPGEEEETILLSTGVLRWGDSDKMTLVDITYYNGLDLGYDKIVLKKQK